MKCDRARPLGLAFGLVFGLGLAAAAEAKPAGVVWLDDYGKALQEARASNRMLMYDFYTSWCLFCKNLDREAFVDPRVVELSRHFVTVKLDAEVAKACATRYRPEGFPTVLFATPQGEEILRVSGYRTADQIYAVMKAVHESGPEISENLARAAKDRKDVASREELGRVYLELGLGEPALKYLEQALKVLPAAAKTAPPGEEAAEARVLFLSGKAARLAEDYKKAAKYLQKAADSFPGSPRLKDYYAALAEAFTAWGKKAEAEKVQGLLEKLP